MSVAFRSSSTAADQTASTFSVTKPTGTADGDLLVAFQYTSLGGGTAPAAPTGWSLADRITVGLTDDLACFYKSASSEPASWTFNNAGGGLSPTSQVRVQAYSGAGTAPEAITKNSGTGTTATATGITTAQANEYLTAAFGIGSNAGTTITPAAGTDLGTIGGSGCKLDATYVLQAAAGASGNKTATLSFSQAWGALLVAIPPPAGSAPVADFTGTPTSGGASLSVAFTDASTNTPTSWLWEKALGEGAFANFSGTPTAQNPTESFAAGTWSVRMTATNAFGSNTKTRTDYITSVGAPVAAFLTSPSSGPVGTTVSFTDQSTGGAPTSWSWDFGDGSTSTSQHPTHTYTRAGVFTVTLTATNVGGSSQATATVTIAPAGGSVHKTYNSHKGGGSILRRRIGRRL